MVYASTVNALSAKNCTLSAASLSFVMYITVGRRETAWAMTDRRGAGADEDAASAIVARAPLTARGSRVTRTRRTRDFDSMLASERDKAGRACVLIVPASMTN